MNLYEYNCVDTEHWPGLAELRPDDGGAGAVQQTVEYRQQYRPSHPQAVLFFVFFKWLQLDHKIDQ